MFEFDAGKFVIIGIVALIVIGPQELPRVMRQLGQALARLRRLSSEFQAQFMDAMREADLEEVKAEAAKIAAAARFNQGLDPLAGIRAELTKTIEASDSGHNTILPPQDLPTNDLPTYDLPTHGAPLAQALQGAEGGRESSPVVAAAIEARETVAAPLATEAAAKVPLEAPASLEGPRASGDVTPLRKRG